MTTRSHLDFSARTSAFRNEADARHNTSQSRYGHDQFFPRSFSLSPGASGHLTAEKEDEETYGEAEATGPTAPELNEDPKTGEKRWTRNLWKGRTELGGLPNTKSGKTSSLPLGLPLILIYLSKRRIAPSKGHSGSSKSASDGPTVAAIGQM